MTTTIKTTCCVVGCGPAGMMAAYLLARAGIQVTVIEKHKDFFRDFRGDTVHPSTLELMSELGILNEFLKIPHQEEKTLSAIIGDERLTIANFSGISSTCKFIVFMPQWDFLNFLSAQAAQYPSFALKMNTEATGLIVENDRIAGIKTISDNQEIEIMSDLIIAADGRESIIRKAAGFKIQDIGAPMDVLWFRMPKQDGDPPQTLGAVKTGIILIMINRCEYWQCGLVIPKGSLSTLEEGGFSKFTNMLETGAPFLKNRIGMLNGWDDIHLLTVKVDRLNKWHREGLLCIGDAAHAMSPIGGVGINLAIQDAVAAVNILWKPLSEGKCTDADLAKVQLRRQYPTRMTQALQVSLQNNVINPILKSTGQVKAPIAMKILNFIPELQKIPAITIGIGFRPEHIQCPIR